jgi:hypothetical protein
LIKIKNLNVRNNILEWDIGFVFFEDVVMVEKLGVLSMVIWTIIGEIECKFNTYDQRNLVYERLKEKAKENVN